MWFKKNKEKGEELKMNIDEYKKKKVDINGDIDKVKIYNAVRVFNALTTEEQEEFCRRQFEVGHDNVGEALQVFFSLSAKERARFQHYTDSYLFNNQSNKIIDEVTRENNSGNVDFDENITSEEDCIDLSNSEKNDKQVQKYIQKQNNYFQKVIQSENWQEKADERLDRLEKNLEEIMKKSREPEEVTEQEAKELSKIEGIYN